MSVAVPRVLQAEPLLKVVSCGPFRKEPGGGSGVDPQYVVPPGPCIGVIAEVHGALGYEV